MLISLLVSCGLSISFLVIKYWIWLVQRVWFWIDDSPPPYWNPFTVFLMRLWGFHLLEQLWDGHNIFKKGEKFLLDKTETRPFTVLVWFLISISGPIIYLASHFYPVTLLVVMLILLAYLARFFRRSGKSRKVGRKYPSQ